ncbi:Multidrug resistance efflux pump OS=Singulisphaera acidiphila (strain ATCC BAA-1392 / DSM 18658 / VKM B-2454 / MOB10) GN=Sinac_2086 PE=4 SV=1 [Gemmata massiliana]|uniref:Multidrug resistance efflux pump n=1 Tax=Gemmata massiliana TaxID=1210884 RepID=A0A6P2DJ56_9BACT|nr:hypothetical protein [Gemmata massiliana]VTS02184.1 Multidrug resistance efflux pump OS=Singulisphaera acidiphila (strain ATCC BAA-1392 / DSM 18658 / VKM B-2454 / MOB10) GN=Sinac_2086 PE=4 SV=1 [Gemmata massiliana]
MNWLHKARPVLIVTGLALVIGSLIGARELAHGSTSDASAKGDAPRATGGTIVLGTVDTNTPHVSYGLPPVLSSGTVSKVFVTDREEVKVDQPLYAFDATLQQATVDSAKAAVALAETKVAEAKEGKKRHAKNIEVMKKGVEALNRRAGDADNIVSIVKANMENGYKQNGFQPNEWPAKLKNEPQYAEAQSKYTGAYNEWEIEKAKLEALEAVNAQLPVDQAEAAVKQAQAELARAQIAVDMCVVKAKVAGTVEQVSISAGTTLGISTRAPALLLIPAGPRIVRAEVEAEFAHRLGNDRIGKQVTISDHSDAKLTYTGVVRDIGKNFLPKRANAENLIASDTRALEAVIEITDPSPAGKPPLRVGQRVRVNLGQ